MTGLLHSQSVNKLFTTSALPAPHRFIDEHLIQIFGDSLDINPHYHVRVAPILDAKKPPTFSIIGFSIERETTTSIFKIFVLLISDLQLC